MNDPLFVFVNANSRLRAAFGPGSYGNAILFLGTDQIPRLQPDSCYNLAHGCGPRLARGGRRG